MLGRSIKESKQGERSRHTWASFRPVMAAKLAIFSSEMAFASAILREWAWLIVLVGTLFVFQGCIDHERKLSILRGGS